jgi:hypothetical protein
MDEGETHEVPDSNQDAGNSVDDGHNDRDDGRDDGLDAVGDGGDDGALGIRSVTQAHCPRDKARTIMFVRKEVEGRTGRGRWSFGEEVQKLAGVFIPCRS